VRYENEDGTRLVPSERYPKGPRVSEVDAWTGVVACDLAFPDGAVARYWRVVSRSDAVTVLLCLA